jgi:Tol biopolymer transport system component
MGEVYRARDSRLGRDVAIKVLPEVFTADAERLSRFEREARLLATLNHPHIGAIYGLEEAAGVRGLVLELVEGETLADHLRAGPLPVREALTLARQIADALEAAHGKGIVHRDLKPANIIITPDGVVKVLDFGLAKGSAHESPSDPMHSPTVTVAGTREGVILGTAKYMSPEQARGKAVDKRTDVWAFGCVLYQMLTAQAPFEGDTVSDTIVSILEREPAWDRLPANTPAGVRRLLQRCLQKDRKRRLHDIADARIEIDEALEAPATAVAPRAERAGRGFSPAVWILAGLIAGGLIAAFGFRFLTTKTPNAVTRFAIALPEKVALGSGLALSPDGRTLVYSGSDHTGTRLYRRSLDALESAPIRGAEGGRYPFFSPDGASVGFSIERTLKTVPLKGGTAIAVAEIGYEGGAATWLSDDTIVFAAQFRGLRRVPASGGEARQLTTLDRKSGELGIRWPVIVPGDRAVLFTIHYGARDTQRVHALSLESGKRAMLVQGNGARFLPTGHILFQRNRSLWIAPFDQLGLRLTGPPTVVIDDVAIADDWSPIVALSASGSLAYAIGGEPYPPRRFVWVDRSGREEPIEVPPRPWFWPRISPDGKRLGFHDMDPVNMDAWIYDLDDRALIRMTYAPEQDGYPVWSPDGKHIAFWSRQGGDANNLYVRSADLTGTEKRLTTSPNQQKPFSWADGGRLLVFHEDTPETGLDIGVVPIDGSGKPTLLIRGPSDEAQPAVSPDGRWIAYRSNFSGRPEIYVQPFPGLGGRWQVSTQGGLTPTWHPSGRELFYRSGRAMISVPVETTGASFRHGSPRVLFEGDYVSESTEMFAAQSYAVRPDGQRFLLMKEERPRSAQIVVVLNWVEELKEKIR